MPRETNRWWWHDWHAKVVWLRSLFAEGSLLEKCWTRTSGMLKTFCSLKKIVISRCAGFAAFVEKWKRNGARFFFFFFLIMFLEVYRNNARAVKKTRLSARVAHVDDFGKFDTSFAVIVVTVGLWHRAMLQLDSVQFVLTRWRCWTVCVALLLLLTHSESHSVPWMFRDLGECVLLKAPTVMVKTRCVAPFFCWIVLVTLTLS